MPDRCQLLCIRTFDRFDLELAAGQLQDLVVEELPGLPISLPGTIKYDPDSSGGPGLAGRDQREGHEDPEAGDPTASYSAGLQGVAPESV